jgi:hypothetical protein
VQFFSYLKIGLTIKNSMNREFLLPCDPMLRTELIKSGIYCRTLIVAHTDQAGHKELRSLVQSFSSAIFTIQGANMWFKKLP